MTILLARKHQEDYNLTGKGGSCLRNLPVRQWPTMISDNVTEHPTIYVRYCNLSSSAHPNSSIFSTYLGKQDINKNASA
jgi:hypothetical protein